ncbi:P-loop containing nucleoside triphosphate hydrolase protein [Mycena belliarum]|uniref:P-loop containing nucleoside triphosphate hydrolase protein n=1 Tax=Mycena belliarum TaxID=1033014 RepID=A0AAD6U655_9AGAR|nr:P-loop containing nucleoside triphosphate hydrolase protein [Mycena belliae]
MTSPYSPGTRVWLDDSEQGWVPAEVSSCTKAAADTFTLVVKDENGRETTHTGAGSSLPHLRNPPLLESADDLATLSHLNEPSILHAVQTRYASRKIYTYSGIVLLSVNPFEPVPMYTPDIVQRYRERTKGELEPHLFAIAEDAYAAMTFDGKGQTIIVSGESGSGKTEAAKLVIRFIASPKTAQMNSDKNSFVEGASQVEQQIQATNPILEAFGNAKTTRNDNSSRFGKYIQASIALRSLLWPRLTRVLQLLFDTNRLIVGGRVRTYLLERSRLSYQAKTERNYHIFYQLCAGLPSERLEELGLDTDYSKFHYLNQGGPSTSELSDRDKFLAMRDALGVVGIDAAQQTSIFQLLAALLHLGNVSVTQTRTDAIIEDDDASMLRAIEFLGVDAAEFKRWTIKKQITTRSDKIATALTASQAVGVRDSIARFVYACLFEWLVSAINESLAGRYGDAASRAETYVGVLDIYGFEHFDKASAFPMQAFQLCLLDRLSTLSQFNTYVFKLAQEDYVKEKIQWTFIDFDDNQPTIDLIEGKLGILALLDEESRLPLGSDASLLQKLNAQLDKPANKAVYKMPKFANAAFTVAHYALDVTYQVDGFLEKNRDTVPEEQLNLLTSSSNAFLREVFDVALHRGSAEAADPPSPGGAVSKIPDPGRTSLVGFTGRTASVKKPTLGSIFKGSLGTLMDMLRMTNVHYIRCLKPNQHKTAWEFNSLQVLAQLRAAGVIETIRISTAGYPSRWTFEDFSRRRYYPLINWREGPTLLKREQFKRICVLVLQKTSINKSQFEMGETKIFLRNGVLGTLESARTAKLNAIQFLQTNARRLIAMRKYRHFQRSVVGIQSHWRGLQARRAFKEVQQKAHREAEAAKAKKAAKAAAEREKKKASKEAGRQTPVQSEKAVSENGSPGKIKIRRMFSFGSKERTTLALPKQPSPEPPLIGRRPSKLEAATKRLSRSWHDTDSPPRKSPNRLAPPAAGAPAGSSTSSSDSRFSTPIYEQFMKKPAWNASTSLLH